MDRLQQNQQCTFKIKQRLTLSILDTQGVFLQGHHATKKSTAHKMLAYSDTFTYFIYLFFLPNGLLLQQHHNIFPFELTSTSNRQAQIANLILFMFFTKLVMITQSLKLNTFQPHLSSGPFNCLQRTAQFQPRPPQLRLSEGFYSENH